MKIRVTFVNMSAVEIAEAAATLKAWKKDYRAIKPGLKVEMGKKYLIHNTKAGNIIIALK